jgi:hypothetical protein
MRERYANDALYPHRWGSIRSKADVEDAIDLLIKRYEKLRNVPQQWAVRAFTDMRILQVSTLSIYNAVKPYIPVEELEMLQAKTQRVLLITLKHLDLTDQKVNLGAETDLLDMRAGSWQAVIDQPLTEASFQKDIVATIDNATATKFRKSPRGITATAPAAAAARATQQQQPHFSKRRQFSRNRK